MTATQTESESETVKREDVLRYARAGDFKQFKSAYTAFLKQAENEVGFEEIVWFSANQGLGEKTAQIYNNQFGRGDQTYATRTPSSPYRILTRAGKLERTLTDKEIVDANQLVAEQTKNYTAIFNTIAPGTFR